MRERHSRSPLKRYVADDNLRFPKEFEDYLPTKSGVHAKMIAEKMQKTKEICEELEEILKTCRAFEAMAPRQCHFCWKWCRSSPFAYETRLRRVVTKDDFISVRP